MNRIATIGVSAAAAILCCAGGAYADSEALGEVVVQPNVSTPAVAPATEAPALTPEAEKWKFRLTPYFWLGAMNGNLTVKGQNIGIHQDLSDVVNLLEDHFNFGACIHFEAEKGRWGIFTDVLYLDLGGEHAGPLGNLVQDVTSQQFIGELGGFYTLVEPKPRSEGSMPFRVDALAGCRVTWLENSITPTLAAKVTDSQAWIDPIIGARMAVDPTDWLQFSARGDIGGFDIAPGTTTKFSWQIILDLSFRLSDLLNLELGYRWLSQDYEDGSGANLFVYDITTGGPFVGLTFKW